MIACFLSTMELFSLGNELAPIDKLRNYLQMSAALRIWQVLKIIPSVVIRAAYNFFQSITKTIHLASCGYPSVDKIK